MTSSTSDLSAHLLGNRQPEEDDENDIKCGEEEGCMPFSLNSLYDEEYEDSQSGSDKNEQSYLILFVLHVLLFETFGVALYTTPIWLKTNCSFILIVIVASSYKQAIKDYKSSCSADVLLPELLQIIILSLMIFHSVVAAFLLLLISNLCLAVLVTASSISLIRDNIFCGNGNGQWVSA
jgi:hypothetical protein